MKQRKFPDDDDWHTDMKQRERLKRIDAAWRFDFCTVPPPKEIIQSRQDVGVRLRASDVLQLAVALFVVYCLLKCIE